MFHRILSYLAIFGCIVWGMNEIMDDYNIEKPNNHPQIAYIKQKTKSASNDLNQIPKKASSINNNQSATQSSQPPIKRIVPQAQKTPTNTIDPISGYKWKNPTVQCVINTDNPKLILAYKDAINAWNQTNSFHFELTTNNNAPLTLGEQNLSNTKSDNGAEISQELGITNTSYYPEQHLLAKADVKLDNDPMLLNNSRQFIAWVAEHELGHAIGLAHTDQNANSVMVPVNPTHGITNNDIATVKQLYHEN